MLFSLLIILFICFPRIEAGAAPETDTILRNGDYEYVDKGDGTARITNYLGTKKDVIIPSKIAGLTVTDIGYPSLWINKAPSFHGKGITSISIPDTVKLIGLRTFANNELTSLDLPDSVQMIGTEAFSNNKLVTIKLPNSLKEIRSKSFQQNKLKTLTLPNNLEVIFDNAFRDNELEQITIPKSVSSIKVYAFSENNLSEVKFLNSQTEIETKTFEFMDIKFTGSPFISNQKDLTFIGYNPSTAKKHADEQEYSFVDIEGNAMFTPDGSSSWVKNVSTIVKLNGYDLSKTLRYTWTNSSNPPPSEWNKWKTLNDGAVIASPSDSGEWYIHVRGTNMLGETANNNSKVFRIDNTLPTVSLSQNGGSWAKSHSTKINAKDSDSGLDTVQYQWTTSTTFPSNGWTTGNNGITVNPPTSTDDHYLHVRATDKAGNVKQFTSSVFKVDRTAPTAPTINAPTEWKNSNVSVTIKDGTDSDSGVSKSQYRIGTGSWQDYSSAFTVSTNGETTVQARTYDKAGNVSSVTNKVIKVDKEKPTLNLSLNTTEITDKVIITAKGTDSDSGVKRIQNPDGTWVNESSTTYTVTSNGTYEFVVEDNAGNRSKESIEVSNIEYLWKDNGDGTATILEYLGNKSEIKIPSSFDGLKVTTLDVRSFASKNLTRVVIPNTVTTIKENAFSLNGIKEVTIPNSVTTIGDSAFLLNELTKVTLSDNLTRIGDYAFQSNHIESIKLPSSLKTIGQYAFEKNQLASISIPNGVTSIGVGAFQENILKSISLPDSLTELKETVFAENHITSVDIPEGMKLIGEYAFFDNKLTEVVIPENITNIKSNAFDSNSIKKVTVYNDSVTIAGNAFRGNQSVSTDLSVYGHDPSTAKSHAEANNYRFIAFEITDYEWIDNGDGTATITKYIGKDKSIEIPSVLDDLDVAVLGSKSFENKGLTNVILPDSVVRIADHAFSKNELSSINFPESLERIGEGAFADNKLTKILIPDKVIIVGNSAFKDNNISNITLGEKVRTIGSEAFANNKISKVTILDHVKTIGNGALAGNQSNSKNLVISGYDPSEAKRYADAYDHTFFNLLENDYVWEKLSDNTARILDYVGDEKELEIITTLGGNKVTEIGTGAFQNKGLTHVKIPNTVTIVENKAFANNKLTGVTISNSVTTIGNEAFIGNEMKEIVIPNSVTTIGTSAFANNKLVYLTIGTGLSNLQAGIFSGNNLTEVTIPKNITTVGQNVFQNNVLEKVYILNDQATINDSAFSGNQSTPAKLIIFGYDPSTAKSHANSKGYAFEVLAYFSEDSQIQIINNAEITGKHYATRNYKYSINADGVFLREDNHKQNYYMDNPNTLKDKTIDYSFSYEYTNHYQKNYKCVDKQGSDCFEWEFVDNTPVWDKGKTSTWTTSLEVDHKYGETFTFDEDSSPELELVTERIAKINGNESSSIEKDSSKETFTVNAESTILETQTWKEVAEEITYHSDQGNELYFKPENMFYFPYDLESNLRDKYQNETGFEEYSDYAIPLRVGEQTDDSIIFNTADNFYVTKNTGYQFSLPYSVSALAQIQSNAKEQYESDVGAAYDDEVLNGYFDASRYYLNIDGNAEQEPDTFYDDNYVLGELGLSDVTFHLNEKLKFKQYLIGHGLDNPAINEQQETVISDIEYTDSITLDSEIINEVKQIAKERNDLIHGFRSTDVIEKYNQLQDIFSFLE